MSTDRLTIAEIETARASDEIAQMILSMGSCGWRPQTAVDFLQTYQIDYALEHLPAAIEFLNDYADALAERKAQTIRDARP